MTTKWLKQQSLSLYIINNKYLNMKQTVIAFIGWLIPCCILFSENIYEDALNHFFQEMIEDVEHTQIIHGKDSVYHHVVLFENNDSVFEKIPDSLYGYKIKRINNVKAYIDTCSNGSVIVYTIEKINYYPTFLAPFCVDIVEYVMRKENNKLIFDDSNLYQVCYGYECGSRSFLYQYLAPSNGGAFKAKYLAKKKGWTDTEN